MIKNGLFILTLGLGTFFLLEISLMVLVKSGSLNILMPNYEMNPHEDFLPVRSNIYGHQHLPNSTYRVKKYCLNTFYEFNELGFRDKLHPKKSSEKRVMVIGDSFMEGVGVNEEERLPDLLEKETGLSHLNFGMADKGTTQAFVIYDSIAKKYSHDAILWSLFPTNDLIDDDPNFGKSILGIKPCWSGEFPNYDLQFFPKDAPAEKSNVAIKRFLKSYTYTYDALFYLKENFKLKYTKRESFPSTGYFNYSEEQLKRMVYSIEKVKEASNGKPITIICIPSTLDLDPKTERNQENIEIHLRDVCHKLGINFLGLYELFNSKENPIEAYYFECDSHWNPKGHELVLEYLKDNGEIYK